MIRFIVLIVIAIAIFWGFNNFNFAQFKDNAIQTMQKEKTVKAVTGTRDFNYEQEQKAINNEFE